MECIFYVESTESTSLKNLHLILSLLLFYLILCHISLVLQVHLVSYYNLRYILYISELVEPFVDALEAYMLGEVKYK